jgi:hypothetical protein
MANDKPKGLETMKAMWPRPRIGQHVRLKKNGRVAEVVMVTKARDVLKSMTEMEALLLGPRCQALYGIHWLDIYYEAIVMVPGTMMQQTIKPTDVDAIVEPD